MGGCHDQLYKCVRGILNKLTTDNFPILLEQIKSQKIDTTDKLNGVIKLVFEKAVDEPNFSAAYAQLCKELTTDCFAINCEQNLASFKMKLISKCQKEFVENVIDGNSITSKLAPIRQKMKMCTDADVKLEYRHSLIEEEKKLRDRSACTVRFIGELYRMDMLTGKIMNWCVSTLLDGSSEEKLEYLCKLLTTIGKKLDTKTGNEVGDKKRGKDMTIYFNQMQKIVNQSDSNTKISSRIKLVYIHIDVVLTFIFRRFFSFIYLYISIYYFCYCTILILRCICLFQIYVTRCN